MSKENKIDPDGPWTMYYVNPYGLSRIDRVLVYKKTRMFVTLKSIGHVSHEFYRVKKDDYFDTFDEAKTYLIGRQIGLLEKAEATLLRVKKGTDEAKNLTEADCRDR